MPSPTTTIAHALKGVDFPCSREALLEYARRNQAETDAIDLLSSMPERSYRSMAEVFRGIKRAKEPEEEDEPIAAEPPPEPEDFYKEIRNPPPLAMPAPEPHQTEVLLAPWLWPWDIALRSWDNSLRSWELAWRLQTSWWKPPDSR